MAKKKATSNAATIKKYQREIAATEKVIAKIKKLIDKREGTQK